VPFLMLLLAAFLTAFYMFRIVFLTFFGARGARREARGAHLGRRTSDLDPRDSKDTAHHGHGVGSRAHAHDAPWLMTGPLWILALIAMGIGILLTIQPPRPEAEFHAPAWAAPIAIAAAFGGILLAWLTYQRRAISADTLASIFAPIRYAALRRFWIDDLFLAIYRGVLLAFSRLVGWIDRYLVDGILNVVSAWTLEGGDRLRRVQTGKVQDYVFALGFGLLALIVWMGVSR
jgi:NADH-quinone oxidoreductase subunit L